MKQMDGSPISIEAPMRPCEVFLNKRGELLADHGYLPDPSRVRLVDGAIRFYHYARRDRVEKILAADGGLWARLRVVSDWEDHAGLYLVEGLLDPLPLWMTDSPYFGNFGLFMLRQYVGDLLLEITVPCDFPGLYVVDDAHWAECKHILRRGRPVLNLGYDTTNGKEGCLADVNSYIPAANYQGGHVMPRMKATRRGPGIAIPPEYIKVCAQQPLQEGSTFHLPIP